MSKPPSNSRDAPKAPDAKAAGKPGTPAGPQPAMQHWVAIVSLIGIPPLTSDASSAFRALVAAAKAPGRRFWALTALCEAGAIAGGARGGYRGAAA